MSRTASTSNRLLYPSPGEYRVLYPDGDTADIIRAIQYADRRSAEFVRPAAASRLRGGSDFDTLRNIYQFVKGNVRYRADRPGHEVVQSPAHLLQHGAGDCKSLSVAIAAMCRAAGIPYAYRFVRQAGAARFHHVYIVAFPKDGSAPGGRVYLDAVHQTFNRQPNHVEAMDLRPGQRVPAGIRGVSSESTLSLVLLLALLFVFAQPVKRRK